VNRKDKKLLIVLLACAVLLVAKFYSPISSPESNLPNSYFAKNKGVSFSERIANSPAFGGFGMHNSSSSLLRSRNSYSDQPIMSFNNNYIANTEYPSSETELSSNKNTTYSIQNIPIDVLPKQSTNAAAPIGMGSAISIVGKSTNDDGSNPQLNGFLAISNLDLSVFDELTPRQGGDYEPGSGATDPGEDPTEEPIPVPDGFWVLLAMLIAYAGIKYIKKKPLTA